VTSGRGQERPPAQEKQNKLYPARRVLGTTRGGEPPIITYAPRTDASPEAERAALVAVLRYVLDCHQEKQAGAVGTGDEAKGVKYASPDPRIPR